ITGSGSPANVRKEAAGSQQHGRCVCFNWAVRSMCLIPKAVWTCAGELARRACPSRTHLKRTLVQWSHLEDIRSLVMPQHCKEVCLDKLLCSPSCLIHLQPCAAVLPDLVQ